MDDWIWILLAVWIFITLMISYTDQDDYREDNAKLQQQCISQHGQWDAPDDITSDLGTCRGLVKP